MSKYLDKEGLEQYHDLIKDGLYEYIEGTQTSATSTWTGVSNSPSLTEGKLIVFHLPYTGGSAVPTLNLTLPNGSTTGAKTVGTRIGTSYSADSNVILVYDGSMWSVVEADGSNLSGVTATELSYLSGVTSNVQIQLNNKQNTLTFDSIPTFGSTNPVTSNGIKAALDNVSSPKFHFEIVESAWPGEYQSSATLNIGWHYSSNGVAITYECGDSISVDQNTGQIIIDNPTIVTYGATTTGDINTYGDLAGKYIKFLSCTGPDSNGYCTTILGNTSCAWYIPKAISTYQYSSSNMYVYQAGYSSSDSNKIKRYVAKMVYDDATFQDTWVTLAQKDYSYYYDERDNSHTITIGDFSNEIGQIPYYAKKIRFRVNINRLNNNSYYGYHDSKSFYQFYVTDSTNTVYLFNETSYNGWRTLDGLSLNCESIFKCIDNGVGANSSVSFTFMNSSKSLVYLNGSTKGQNTGVRIVLNYQLYGYVDINTTCYLDYLI